MRYGYWWGPEETAPEALRGVLPARRFHDTDQFRRQFSALRVALAPGDELTVADLSALGPSLVGALNVLVALLDGGVSVTVAATGRFAVDRRGKRPTATVRLLAVLQSVAAAQARMLATEVRLAPEPARRGRPPTFGPGQRLAVLDYATTHTQQATAAHFGTSRATVTRIIAAHAKRFR
ncbi:recombinase family protein [Lacticaseibacillus kribbianus]|uniref:recombinase family protein n=1 Tax=Lacticaseibacillus kribbianus TaxID=2926292 RepID=UPI001CD72D17|nr:recombinase family protein [Lacticaseibacillus kribbianus]